MSKTHVGSHPKMIFCGSVGRFQPEKLGLKIWEHFRNDKTAVPSPSSKARSERSLATCQSNPPTTSLRNPSDVDAKEEISRNLVIMIMFQGLLSLGRPLHLNVSDSCRYC